MHFTVYKITNLLDGKFYIGKHQTENLEDDYYGSGNYVRRAIAKHGLENFKKEILFVFDNEADMNAKEAELVTRDICDRDDTYNLCEGGKGGWSYTNRKALNRTFGPKPQISAALSGRSNPHASAKMKAWHESGGSLGRKPTRGTTGKKFSEETKQKMRLAALNRKNK